MDKQIEKTIQDAYGDLEGMKTDEFYNVYKIHCSLDKVKPRPKNVVIREACDACGMKTKPVSYRVFGVKS